MGRKHPKWAFKNWASSYVKEYITLLKNHGSEEGTIKRLKRAIKNKIYDELDNFFDPSLEKSKMKTVVHGDFWVNNILFSSDDPNDTDLKVTLVDFQQLTLCHPARDLWYLLYSNVDREFRTQHLHTVLKEYFQVFSSYLRQGGTLISYEDFLREINWFRAGMALLYSSMMLMIGLNPEPLRFATTADTRHVTKTFKRQLSEVPKESDDPLMKEIRRRILGTILELDDEGLLS